jgi:hypothetical protein
LLEDVTSEEQRKAFSIKPHSLGAVFGGLRAVHPLSFFRSINIFETNGANSFVLHHSPLRRQVLPLVNLPVLLPVLVVLVMVRNILP